MAAITVDQLTALVESLTQALADAKRTSTNFDLIVATKAKALSDKLNVQYAKAAQDQIAAKDAELRDVAFELRRANDLIVELRLQLEVQARMACEGREAKIRLDNVRRCKPWTDDLGRRFVYCDELWHATDPEHNPAPVPARIDKEI